MGLPLQIRLRKVILVETLLARASLAGAVRIEAGVDCLWWKSFGFFSDYPSWPILSKYILVQDLLISKMIFKNSARHYIRAEGP